MPFERFDAWRVCHELAIAVYFVTKSYPKDERYGSPLPKGVDTEPAHALFREGQIYLPPFQKILPLVLAEEGHNHALDILGQEPISILGLDDPVDTVIRRTPRLKVNVRGVFLNCPLQ